MTRGARWTALAGKPAASSPSRHDLQNRRMTVWQCAGCGFRHIKPAKAATAAGIGPGFVCVDKRPKVCGSCASPEIVKFDSKAEAGYAAQLLMLQRAGVISGLHFHPVIVVPIPQAAPGGTWNIVKYTADGSYTERDGRRVVYDVKAKGAPLERDFVLRRRIVEAAHGIKIEIVRR